MADEAANDARGTRRNHDDRDDGYGGVVRSILQWANSRLAPLRDQEIDFADAQQVDADASRILALAAEHREAVANSELQLARKHFEQQVSLLSLSVLNTNDEAKELRRVRHNLETANTELQQAIDEPNDVRSAHHEDLDDNTEMMSIFVKNLRTVIDNGGDREAEIQEVVHQATKVVVELNTYEDVTRRITEEARASIAEIRRMKKEQKEAEDRTSMFNLKTRLKEAEMENAVLEFEIELRTELKKSDKEKAEAQREFDATREEVAEVNRRLEVAKAKLKAVKDAEARADEIEKELAAEEDAKKKEIEEKKLAEIKEGKDALVASEVGDEEIIDDGGDYDSGGTDSDEEFDLVIETCRVDLPPGWNEDKTGNGPNERPREYFVTCTVNNKTEWIPEDLGKIEKFLSSCK